MEITQPTKKQPNHKRKITLIPQRINVTLRNVLHVVASRIFAKLRWLRALRFMYLAKLYSVVIVFTTSAWEEWPSMKGLVT